GIGLAACDTESVIDSLAKALEAGIPVVCFDTGVPNAPEGSVYATVATDNLAAGACAAENMFPVIEEVVKAATADAPVRIGEVNQDATAQNIQDRGLGFINKMIELCTAAGKKVAVVGNQFYVDACSDKGDEATAEVIIEVAVPAQTTVELSAAEAQNIMAKEDTIAIFGSNQVTAEGVITANSTLNVLGTDPATNVVAAGFDAGTPQKEAINSGLFIGSVTQSPLMQGYECIKTLYAICQGESVEDYPMNGYWYDTTNMTDDNIAPNLYD
ncbi:MAG: substrate-binding domain-containing protein, partial [Lachnospiraceae bacterium]|nr:substrate-binding domain-containing protein [Lachnospiraceae bacterium]